jgi:hypothetical protein
VKDLYFINSINEYLIIKNELSEEDLIIYTSEILSLYFKKKKPICCFESFFKDFSERQVRELKKTAEDQVYDFAYSLDIILEKYLVKEFGKKFKIFQLFVYHLSLTYANLLLLKIKIKHYKNNYNRVIMFDKSITSFIGVDIYLSNVLVFKNVEFRNELQEKIFIFSLQNFKRLLSFIYKSLRKLNFHAIQNSDKAKIIYFEPEYDLQNTRKKLSRFYNFINYEKLVISQSKINLSFIKVLNFNIGSCKMLQNLFFQFAVLLDSNKNSLLGDVSNFSLLVKKNNIRALAWGNPPVRFNRTTFTISSIADSIPVYGFQHGACYGSQIRQGHLHSDFLRCSHFVSYGFEKKDINYLNNIPKTFKIIPRNRNKTLSKCYNRFPKILYVPTNSVDLYRAAITRSLPNKLLDSQINILKHLNFHVQMSEKVIVKPFIYATEKNSFFLYDKHHYKNLKFDTGCTLNRYLSKHTPELIILDLPSTPLYDCIDIDCEIFLLVDNINPLTNNAYSLLDKRVHLFDNVSSLTASVCKFTNKTLKPKRDGSFSSYYVNNPNGIIDVFKEI